MSQRGRGCLEIRPSDSAFYRTTTSEIGDTVVREGRRRDDEETAEVMEEKIDEANDKIGVGEEFYSSDENISEILFENGLHSVKNKAISLTDRTTKAPIDKNQ